MSRAPSPASPRGGRALAPLEGKYEIVAKINEGGMGAIYKVRHRLLDEIRVVKVLRHGLERDADLEERFLHEARAAIRLRHPNVVQIFDFLIESGTGFIVMEYIDGVDLSELVRGRRRPSLPLFLEIARQGLRALGYLHQRGFVHRDISTDNLMLSSDFAGRPLVKMIDLGIAKDVEGGPAITSTGVYLGKFRYSSPEHFGSQGTGGIEPRSDLYSYGVVLYEWLTGNYPIQGEDASQLIAGHLFHPPRDFDETDPEERVPKALRAILSRSLDKDPKERFASADEFADALSELRSQFPPTAETFEEADRLKSLREAEEPVGSDSAQEVLDHAFHGPTPAGPSREEQLFDHHLQTACALAEEGSFADAIPHFEAALGVRPDNTAVRHMLEEARQTLDEEQKVSRERLAGEIRQLRTLLASGNVVTARGRLVSARRAYGESEPLAEIEREIAQAEDETRLRHVEEKLAEAVRLREEGRITVAVQKLESVREAWRSSALDESNVGLDLLVQIDREEALLEEAHRQAAALDEAIYEVESWVEAGKLVEADRGLFQAIEAFGEIGRLRKLRQRVEDAWHEQRRRQVERLAGEIEVLVEGRNLEQAQARLEMAGAELESFGAEEAAIFDALREQISDGFQERVNALIHEAGVALEAGRYGAAIPFLEQALEFSPGDEWLADRLEQARAALREGSD